MDTTTLKITFNPTELSIFQPLFDKFKLKTTVLERADDFSELTEEDLRSLALSEEQSRLGMLVDSSEVHRRATERRRQRYESKVDSRS